MSVESPAHGPEVSTPRRFCVVWRNPEGGPSTISPIGLLDFDEGHYTFSYLPRVGSIEGFRPLLGFPNLDTVYPSKSLFPFFAERVMGPRRPDYARYIEALALPADASDLDVLGRMGGKRKGDKIQVVEEPEVNPVGETAHAFLVSGIRHRHEQFSDVAAGLATIEAGEAMRLLPEPANPVNSDAILITTSAGVALGWVPDLLVKYVKMLQAHGPVDVRALRVNGPDFPWHMRLVVEVRGNVRPGFRAFAETAVRQLSSQAGQP